MRNRNFALLFTTIAATIALPFLAASHPFHDNGYAEESNYQFNNPEVRALQERVARDSATAEDFQRLGWALITEARTTRAEYPFALAAETARQMREKFGETPASRLLLAHALHNMHRFGEAETIARSLVRERGAPMDYALLSDVLLELGRLDEATVACGEFARIKPGLEAYSRVSHIRWLHGDIDGAVAAMEQAVLAGSGSNSEPLAWCLCRLSHLYLQQRRFVEARAAANKAGELIAGYPPALFALGRAEVALGNLHSGAEYLSQAATLNPIPEFQWWQSEALASVDRNIEAAAAFDQLEQNGSFVDPRTMALFLSTRGMRTGDALQFAQSELEKRPDTFSWDAVAWALFAAGDTGAASEAIEHALQYNIRDARVLLHAGIIAREMGRDGEADSFLEEAASLSATLTPIEHRLLDRQRESLTAASFPHTENPHAQANNHQPKDQS